jgi:prevent-host-death family protein
MCYMDEDQDTVGVRELRQNLSVYLDRVKNGETLTVTEHRQAVAVLGPARADADPIAALVSKGLAARGSRTPAERPRAIRASLNQPLSRVVRDLGDDTV